MCKYLAIAFPDAFARPHDPNSSEPPSPAQIRTLTLSRKADETVRLPDFKSLLQRYVNIARTPRTKAKETALYQPFSDLVNFLLDEVACSEYSFHYICTDKKPLRGSPAKRK